MLCNTPTANRGGILTLAAGCTDGRYAQKVYFAKRTNGPLWTFTATSKCCGAGNASGQSRILYRSLLTVDYRQLGVRISFDHKTQFLWSIHLLDQVHWPIVWWSPLWQYSLSERV